MRPHRPTAESGVHRTARLLLAIATAISLTMVIACSGDEPPPTDRPDRDQPQLEKTIEAVTGELTALQTKMAESQGTPGVERPTKSGQPSPTEPSTTPTPPATPTPLAIARPTGPGICGRSPQIQRAILDTLQINLCSVVSPPELLRITALPTLHAYTLTPGDFQDLVNLQGLTLIAPTIPAGAFLGLENLKYMKLSLYTYSSVAPGAFQGLDNLEHLTIETNKPDSEQEDTLLIPNFDRIPKLRTLQMDYIPALYAETITDQFFKDLPSLEELTIRLESNQQDETKEATATLPSGLFAHNPNLTTINFTVHSLPNVVIRFPKDLFEKNTELQTLNIDGKNYHLPTTIFRHIEKLENLRLEGNRANEKPELELSKTSPLYNKITYGSNNAQGYRLAGTD